MTLLSLCFVQLSLRTFFESKACKDSSSFEFIISACFFYKLLWYLMLISFVKFEAFEPKRNSIMKKHPRDSVEINPIDTFSIYRFIRSTYTPYSHWRAHRQLAKTKCCNMVIVYYDARKNPDVKVSRI